MLRTIIKDINRELSLINTKNTLKCILSVMQSRNIWIILTYRFGSTIKNIKFIPIRILLTVIYYITDLLILRKVGVYFDRHIKCGCGIRFAHPFGIFITPQTSIGKYCTIFNNVTIGVNHLDRSGFPIIGDYVVIYPGAKIIGNIKIGNNSIIGANAVVVNDIEDNSIVGGVPAKLIRKRKKKDILVGI